MYTDYCWYIIIHYSAKVDFNPHNNQISGHYCTSMFEMIFSIVGMKQFGEDEVNYKCTILIILPAGVLWQSGTLKM